CLLLFRGLPLLVHLFFSVTATAPTATSPLSLHDALPIYGNVQRRDRLVADDELGVHGQGAGDAHALPLPARELVRVAVGVLAVEDRKSTRLNSSHVSISYAVFCLKKKKMYHDSHFLTCTV